MLRHTRFLARLESTIFTFPAQKIVLHAFADICSFAAERSRLQNRPPVETLAAFAGNDVVVKSASFVATDFAALSVVQLGHWALLSRRLFWNLVVRESWKTRMNDRCRRTRAHVRLRRSWQ